VAHKSPVRHEPRSGLRATDSEHASAIEAGLPTQAVRSAGFLCSSGLGRQGVQDGDGEAPLSPSVSGRNCREEGQQAVLFSSPIGQETFAIDCFALSLDGFDLVLGVKWLKTLGPVSFDFGAPWMAFWRDGRPICWHDIGAKQQTTMGMAAATTEDLIAVFLSEFADIFTEPRGLPPLRHHDHRIHLLPDTVPVAVHPYCYPQLLKDELEKQCADMLAQGIIRPSTSPFSSPVLLVKKADGSWRFCVDYRALNDRTVKNKFPIPVVDELLDELKGAKCFTKIDSRSGYHQVRMHVDDILKTAFRTHQGLFEFLVMPFGLTNAPATFQALMNEVLGSFLRRFVLVFFDYILIYSSSLFDHVKHVKAVFQLLRKHQLRVKHSKCFFGATSV